NFVPASVTPPVEVLQLRAAGGVWQGGVKHHSDASWSAMRGEVLWDNTLFQIALSLNNAAVWRREE
ncbi:hypothetical protein JOQ06_002766, partial [Pogonophryne albipinna]